ncbi:hypothetical protein [Spiroplasma citri]|uniref:hypothetical protein n=1 Tax=Spiroplasma citri TaxID=2133 RepID=UPI00148B1470|nr:hypothetical protein [Spiroplasma citri]QJU61011.1 hypothetical protein HHA36_00135 [Spiroplasma citri]
MDKNVTKNKKSSFNNFIDKIFKLMDTYDINENTIILVLSDGEKQIKKNLQSYKNKL